MRGWCAGVQGALILFYTTTWAEAAQRTLKALYITEQTGPFVSQPTYYRGFGEFFVPYVNSHGGIPLGNDTYNIEVIICDTSSEMSGTVDCVEKGHQGLDREGNAIGDIDLIIGGSSRSISWSTAAAQPLRMPNVHCSGGDPRLWKAEHDFAFGMGLPYIWYTRGLFSMASIRGLQTATIVRSVGHPFSMMSCIAALAWVEESSLSLVGPTVSWCRSYAHLTGECRLVVAADSTERCVCGIQADVDSIDLSYQIEEVTTFYEMDENKMGNGLVWRRVDPNTTAFAAAMIRDMRAQGADPEIFLNFATEWHNVLNALWLEDYAPKMLMGWQGAVSPAWAADESGTTNATHGYWAVGFGQWHQAMNLLDPVFGSNAEAVKAFESAMGMFLDYDTASCIAAGVTLYKVLSSYVDPSFGTMTLTDRREAIQQGFMQMNDETMWGTVRFNRFHQNSGRGTAAWQIIPEDEDGALVPKQRCILPPEAAEVELSIPFPSWDSRFGCPPGTYNSGTACLPCQPGTFSPATGPGLRESECQPCAAPLGTLPDTYGATSCQACPAGRANEGGFPAGVCSACPAGTSYDPSVDSEPKCHRCQPGQYINETASSTCWECGLGTFMRDSGATACQLCAAGLFGESTGQTACPRCELGTYQPEDGKSECLTCSSLVATGSTTAVPAATHPSECLCPAGTYFLLSQGQGAAQDWNATEDASVGLPTCATCPGGLLCEPGRGEPKQDAGYHGGRPEYHGGPPSFVVACRKDKICPAGNALGACPPYRRGRACDLCVDGYSQSGDSCMRCAGRATWLGPVALILGFFVLAILMWLYAGYIAGSAQTQDVLTVTITSSIIVNCIQAVSVFGKLSIDWIEPMDTLAELSNLFTFRVDFLNLGCLFDSGDVVLAYTISLAIYLVFALMLFCCLLLPMPQFLARTCGLRRKHAITWDRIMNMQGLILLVAYISLAVVSTSPWQCRSNPDGTSSVHVDRSILCWEGGRHTSMVLISVAGICGYIIIPMAIVFHAVIVYPYKIARDNGASFLQRYEFLFKRFSPKCFYYVAFYIVRNLTIALIPVVFAQEMELQILCMVMLVVGSGMFQVRLWPWRTRICNFIDAGFSFGLVVLLSAGLLLVDVRSKRGEEVVQMVMIVVLLLSFGIALAFVLRELHRIVFPSRPFGVFLSHHKGAAQVLARWFKLQLTSRIQDGVFLDSDELDELGGLLDVVGRQTKNLLILLSSETLRRMWVACEAVTAYNFKVPIVLVASEDYLDAAEDKKKGGHEWSSKELAEMQELGVTAQQIDAVLDHIAEMKPLQLQRQVLSTGRGDAEKTFRFAVPEERDHLIEAVMKSCSHLKTRHADIIAKAISKRNPAQHTPSRTSNIQLIASLKDPEAFCCAEVMSLILQKDFALATRATPLSHIAFSASIQEIRLLVPLLTSGCVVEENYLKSIIVAARNQVAMIPVTADSRFVFPDMNTLGSHVGQIQDVNIKEAMQAYKALFSTIALKFSEFGSIEIQRAELHALVRRCETKKTTVSASEASVTRGFAQESEVSPTNGTTKAGSSAQTASFTASQKEPVTPSNDHLDSEVAWDAWC